MTHPDNVAEASIAVVPPPVPAKVVPGNVLPIVPGLDCLACGLVILFAFVTACFPATNSDLFLHLATGRFVLGGGFPAGQDPFTYTASVGAWAPSWLFDILFYAIYRVPEVGPEALVATKALLVALLAGVLIAVGSRARQSLLVPACCAALAVLAMSPRLLLQPVVFSYLFLGLTLGLLQRGLERPGRGSGVGSLWWLVPLFALWANIDEHFLLGPLAVALALVGQSLQAVLSGKKAGVTPGQLTVVLVAGLAACLLNPAHVHAFRLPWQLGLFQTQGLAQDRDFRFLFLSPLDESYFQPGLGLHLAGLAWIPLALLGVLSWVPFGKSPRPHGWGLAVWVGFLLLGLANHRSLAFFAVVAGPLLSRNVLERIENLPGGRWPLPLRALALLIVSLLVGGSVPGWFHAAAAHRAFGLGVRTDPSLRQAALQLRAWRERGQLDPATRVFPTTPDSACYLAWFCPEEKGFLDLRLHLFGEAQREFIAARSALQASSDEASSGVPGWRPVFRRWNVRQVVLHYRDLQRAGGRLALSRLLLSTYGPKAGEWTLCYLDGRTAIATWTDPDKQGGPTPPAFDPEGLAFGTGSAAAADGLESPPPSREWPALAPARPLAADDAECFWATYQFLKPVTAWRQTVAWESSLVSASVASQAVPHFPGLAGDLVVQLTARRAREDAWGLVGQQLLQQYRTGQDSGPVAFLYLGVRAARRALAEKSAEAGTWVLLGRLYRELGGPSRETARVTTLPQIPLVRQAQAAAALREALRLDPDNEEAHAFLAEAARQHLFLGREAATGPAGPALQRLPNVELELQQRRERLRCARAAGRSLGESEDNYQRRLVGLDREAIALASRVEKVRDQYEVTVANKPTRVRAAAALERGLNETATRTLTEAYDSGELTQPGGQEGVARLIELLLADGRVAEAARLLDAEGDRLRQVPTPLGLWARDWFLLQLGAATGLYARADEVLVRAQGEGLGANGAAELIGDAVGHVLLWEGPRAAGMPFEFVRRAPPLIGLPYPGGVLTRATSQALAGLNQDATHAALRGWLALEAGNLSVARQEFTAVRARSQTGTGALILLDALPLAELSLERLDGNQPSSPR